ncbi:MAG: DUF402 domain-containing protein [Mobilicoccus sp.]|nr:DUF402 domain-containing protein [Mobilicoccus sp.]
MDAGLSPAELPFGARVRAVFTKYDGTPHWEYDLVVVGVDEHGVWVGGAPGSLIAKPGREIVADVHWVCLYPRDGMWVATFNGSGGAFSSRIYVDITSTPSWWHRPDGVLQVSAIDLDLDVVRRFTGELYVDDIDEFDEHRVAFGYPDDLVAAAREATDWVHEQMADRAEPFEDVARAWLDTCIEHVSTDGRGHATVGDASAPSSVRGTDDPAPQQRQTGGPAPQHEDVEEDLLAVWTDEAASENEDASAKSGPLRNVDHERADEARDDGPAVEVEYDTPVDLDDSFVAHYSADTGSFGEATDIDTSPVEPAEVTGILLTTRTGRTSPLWFDGREVEPEEVDVSDELADHLRDWADRWTRDFDPERGWHPRASIDDYEALGAWLARRLKDEVGGIAVTLQYAHLGRSSLWAVPSAQDREPAPVVLDAQAPGDLPVRGDIVTLDGVVGCFSSTVNTRLEVWAEDGGRDADEARRLVDLMAAELGAEYDVRLAGQDQ